LAGHHWQFPSYTDTAAEQPVLETILATIDYTFFSEKSIQEGPGWTGQPSQV
jgi:hypothetical protein